MRIREPWPSARTRQRRREFAAVFDGVPAAGLGHGLEIGGGDGFLASLVAPHCRTFVTTDPYRARLAGGACAKAVVRRLVCDAASLPFASASFDFIFSSSVLEHVRDRRVLYAEMRRCLRPGGVMVHIMPSRIWKLLQMLLYYPHLVVSGLDLVLDRLGRSVGCARAERSVVTDRWSDCRRVSLRTVLENVVPRPHGEFPGHVAEWHGFGARAWERELRAEGFHVHRVLLLPLYSGYGFGFERLRRFGERRGLSSHNAFVVTAEASSSPALAWFESAPRALEPAPMVVRV
jgi:SAM-dependent methyltransferase